MQSRILRLNTFVLLTFAGLTVSCDGGQPAPATQQPPAGAKRVDQSTAGNIKGRVTYEGPTGDTRPITLNSDPACARENPNGLTFETVVASNGGLENVFVYVKDGLGNYYFDTPTTPATLDQKGCRYTPHVLGVSTGQPLEIINSDPTMHNVHAMGNANREFNFAMAVPGLKTTRTFTAPEVMVHFKCDVHSWMNAYVGVVAHPYFAVTATGGQFELKSVPAGTYTVEAWHEKLGTQTQSVTLAEKESKEIGFTFKATD